MLLRKPLRECLPLVASYTAPVHAQFPLGRVVLRIALYRYHVDSFRIMSMHINHKTEIGRQVSGHFVPPLPGIIAAHDVPVLLHEQDVRSTLVHGNAMHTMTDFSGRIGYVFRMEALIDSTPRLATIVCAERAGCGDGDVDAVGIVGIDEDGVQAHPSCTRCPLWTRAVLAQAGDLLPRHPTVG